MNEPNPNESLPEWILDLVNLGGSRTRFIAACQEAAYRAHLCQQLRHARRRTVIRGGVVALLERLSASAGLDFFEVLAQFGLAGDVSDLSFAAAWGRFAGMLGLSRDDFLTRLRWTWLDAYGVTFRAASARTNLTTDSDFGSFDDAIEALTADQLANLETYANAALEAFVATAGSTNDLT